MSSLTYVNEPGAGQKHSDLGHYSQAVLIGNIAKLSGQGGWDNDGNLDQYDWKQQITNAFDNVDRVLQAAGFRGWEDVSVAIVWYGLDLSDDIIGISPPQLPARHRQPVGVPC
jgi:enamine deaminase RidA (YjgF/YER057c/UK114 family)